MLEDIVTMYQTDGFFMHYVWGFVIAIGLVVGSFLNVVGLRFLANESIVFPASKCPNCNTKLKWYDNIPVLAYILLLGKCRYCKKPISIQYPLVELITAIVFFLTFLKFGFTFATPMLWILFGAGIVMCITDFKEQVIFDIISMPLIPIGLVYSFFNLGNVVSDKIQVFKWNFYLNSTFTDAIIGIIGAFLFFEIISLFSKLMIKQRAFGEGDTIIAMIFGAWFGWKIMLLTIILSVVVQAVFTIPILIAKLFKMKDKVAISSFLILILSALIPLFLNKLIVFNNTGSVIFVFLILGIAVFSALIFLKRMRELDAYTFLPFGPALIVAGFAASMYLTSYIPDFLL